MIGEEGVPVEWEIGRAGKALDFPSIIFLKLAVTVATKIGTRERHQHLQDLTDLLTPYLDGQYQEDIGNAAEARTNIAAGKGLDGRLHAEDDDGHLTPREAVPVHQRLWLAALMAMMKRHGLLGETWIRG